MAIVCNVCGSRIASQIEQDTLTQLLFDMPNAVKAHLIDEANKRRIPIEVVLKRFVEWKFGRPVEAGFYNKSPKKKAKRKLPEAVSKCFRHRLNHDSPRRDLIAERSFGSSGEVSQPNIFPADSCVSKINCAAANPTPPNNSGSAV